MEGKGSGPKDTGSRGLVPSIGGGKGARLWLRGIFTWGEKGQRRPYSRGLCVCPPQGHVSWKADLSWGQRLSPSPGSAHDYHALWEISLSSSAKLQR